MSKVTMFCCTAIVKCILGLTNNSVDQLDLMYGRRAVQLAAVVSIIINYNINSTVLLSTSMYTVHADLHQSASLKVPEPRLLKCLL